LAVICTALTLATVSGAQSGPGSRPTARRHSSGILLLSGDVNSGFLAPAPQAVQLAYQDAVTTSEQFPEDLSWPWIDDQNRVVVRATTSRGFRLAEQLRADAQYLAPPVTVVSRSAAHSRRALDAIMHELIGPQPDGTIIWSSYPDPRSNRVVIDMVDPSDAFLSHLALTYGTDVVAVHLIESSDVGHGGVASGRPSSGSTWGGEAA
jgi:hypothetical protein